MNRERPVQGLSGPGATYCSLLTKLNSKNIQMKQNTAEQHFPMVLSIMLNKVVLTFESVDESLKCDHSNESY